MGTTYGKGYLNRLATIRILVSMVRMENITKMIYSFIETNIDSFEGMNTLNAIL